MLNCSHSDLSVVPKFKSEDYRNVTHIDLSYNNITAIKYYSFRYTLHLSHIDLSHNNIKIVSPGAFFILSRLQFLDLSYNKLQTLPRDIFDLNFHLEALFLKHNPELDITALKFLEELPYLTYLDLIEQDANLHAIEAVSEVNAETTLTLRNKSVYQIQKVDKIQTVQDQQQSSSFIAFWFAIVISLTIVTFIILFRLHAVYAPLRLANYMY